jgi:ABC-type antimicrobial peptide transport system permease subunit
MLFLSCSIAFNSNFIIDRNINESGILNVTIRLKPEIENVNSLKYLDELREISGIDSIERDENFNETERMKIVIDDYRNIENVLEAIESKDQYQIYADIDTLRKIPLVNSLKFVSNLMFMVIVFFSTLILYAIISSSLDESRFVMSTYKALGYKNSDLFSMLISESALLCFSAYMISSLLSWIVMKIIINPILKVRFSGLIGDMDFSVGIPIYIIIFGSIALLIMVSTSMASKKLREISPILLLRE